MRTTGEARANLQHGDTLEIESAESFWHYTKATASNLVAGVSRTLGSKKQIADVRIERMRETNETERKFE